ncbi:MAG: hypothetical protein R3E93_02925 [Thiothrix sp.]
MSDANHADDLTLIKGIGPVRQQWLHEHFNADSSQALAAEVECYFLWHPVRLEKWLWVAAATP